MSKRKAPSSHENPVAAMATKLGNQALNAQYLQIQMFAEQALTQQPQFQFNAAPAAQYPQTQMFAEQGVAPPSPPPLPPFNQYPVSLEQPRKRQRGEAQTIDELLEDALDELNSILEKNGIVDEYFAPYKFKMKSIMSMTCQPREKEHRGSHAHKSKVLKTFNALIEADGLKQLIVRGKLLPGEFCTMFNNSKNPTAIIKIFYANQDMLERFFNKIDTKDIKCLFSNSKNCLDKLIDVCNTSLVNFAESHPVHTHDLIKVLYDLKGPNLRAEAIKLTIDSFLNHDVKFQTCTQIIKSLWQSEGYGKFGNGKGYKYKTAKQDLIKKFNQEFKAELDKVVEISPVEEEFKSLANEAITSLIYEGFTVQEAENQINKVLTDLSKKLTEYIPPNQITETLLSFLRGSHIHNCMVDKQHSDVWFNHFAEHGPDIVLDHEDLDHLRMSIVVENPIELLAVVENPIDMLVNAAQFMENAEQLPPAGEAHCYDIA